MFVVIFRSKSKNKRADPEYEKISQRMYELAYSRYGCKEVKNYHDGAEELTLSYWEDEAAIAAWRNDPEHALARKAGAEKWYEWFHIQVAKIGRDYHSAKPPPNSPPAQS
ncbi:MAG: antibiotic biosynthesis monooxygenase [Candidatus Symbiobacter sp.]|nr:antibiotic biosynthesis monooxygenase [Candidatus Symbiobacter sp.]